MANRTLAELRKIGTDGLALPWHQQGSALEAVQDGRQARLSEAGAILDKAKAEGRALLASEQRGVDGFAREADELRGLVSRFEDLSRARAILPSHQMESSRSSRGGSAMGAELRAMFENIFEVGGAIAPDAIATSVWDSLNAQSIALQMGATVIQTDRAELAIPKVVSDPAASWVGEGDTIVPTDSELAQVVAIPKKLAAIVQVSNELLNDSNPKVLELLMKQLTRSLSLALDAAVFEGDGLVYRPRGLKYLALTNIVTTLGADGAVPTNLDALASAISALETSNAVPSCIAMSPRSWATLLQLKTDSAATRNQPLLMNGNGVAGSVPRSVYGLPVLLSSQISIAETRGSNHASSSIYVAQGDQIVIVRNGQLRVELDKSRLFNQDMCELRAILRADIVLPNEKAVARIVGVRAT